MAGLLYPRNHEYHSALKSLKFYFVRHPFEKLVSCYRDKFEIGLKSDYIFQNFNPRIIQNRYERPTFQQFVQYLIRTPSEKYNDHWLPYWMHCQLCTQKYDVIGHMDTITEDVEYIFKETGLDHYLTDNHFDFPWRNNKHKTTDLEELVKKYFSTITKDEKLKLYDIYRPDFLMFGYDAEKYF